MSLSGATLRERLGQVRRTALLGLVFGVPVFFLWDVTNAPFEGPKLALLVVATAVAAAARVAEILLGAPAAGLRRAALPAAFLGLPLVVSWIGTGYKSFGLLGSYNRFTGVVPILLVLLAGVLLADGFAPGFRAVARALVASAACVGVYAIAQSIGLDPLGIPVVEYVTSTIGHSNFLGGFLAMVLPISLGLTATATGRGRYAAMAAAIPIGLGIVLSFSQGGWVAAAAGMAVYAGAASARRHRLAHPAGWIVAGAIAMATAGIVVFSLVEPFHPVVPDTVRARGMWWRAAVSVGSESPVWGRGPSVFAIEGPHHRVPEDALAHDALYADEPHSVPLGLFANAGILGLGGFVAFAAWIVRRGLRLRGSPLLHGFAAGAAAYLVQSLVSIDTFALMVALWACVAALAVEADAGPTSPPAPAREPGAATKVASIALVVLAAAAGTWWSARFLATDARALDAFDALKDGRSQAAVDAFGDVVRARPDEHYRHLYASVLGTAALREQEDGLDEARRMVEAFEYFEDFPNVRAIFDHADLLHQLAVYHPALEAEALVQVERYLALDEYSPTTRVLAAEILMRLDRADEAVETLETIVSVMEEFPQYQAPKPKVWAALAIAYWYDDRPDEARSALETAEDHAEGTPHAGDCRLLVASEILERSGEPATSGQYRETRPSLVLCRPGTLALLPGWHGDGGEDA